MSQGYYNSENDDSRPNSPYPPSSSCASEEEDHNKAGAHDRRQGRPTLSVRVHSPSSDFALFLDGIPDHTLREVVLRVSNGNSRFQCVLQKELANALSTTSVSATKGKNPTRFALQTPPTTPTTPRTALGASSPAAGVYDKALDTPKARNTNAYLKPHSRTRGRRHTHPPHSHFPASSEEHRQIKDDPHSRPHKARSVAEIVYHPGQMKSHAYEFVARTPTGETSKSVRTIAMWSCCDEDERSPGCVRTITRSPPAPRVPKTLLPSPVKPTTLSTALFEEDASDDTDFASFALAKFSSIEVAHDLEGERRDVYPDSDLEALDSMSLHPSSSILTPRFS